MEKEKHLTEEFIENYHFCKLNDEDNEIAEKHLISCKECFSHYLLVRTISKTFWSDKKLVHKFESFIDPWDSKSLGNSA